VLAGFSPTPKTGTTAAALAGLKKKIIVVNNKTVLITGLLIRKFASDLKIRDKFFFELVLL
jgi:hypothetical protein